MYTGSNAFADDIMSRMFRQPNITDVAGISNASGALGSVRCLCQPAPCNVGVYTAWYAAALRNPNSPYRS
jgi:hypothetical protein